jgi:hypothetical protein
MLSIKAIKLTIICAACIVLPFFVEYVESYVPPFFALAFGYAAGAITFKKITR